MRVSGWYLTSIWPVSEYLSTVLRLVQCFVRLSSAWRVSLLPRVALWRSRLLSVERWKQLESCRVSLNLIERLDASSTLNERHVLNGLKLRRLKSAGGFHMFESLCNNLLKHSAASHIERCMVSRWKENFLGWAHSLDFHFRFCFTLLSNVSGDSERVKQKETICGIRRLELRTFWLRLSI